MSNTFWILILATGCAVFIIFIIDTVFPENDDDDYDDNFPHGV